MKLILGLLLLLGAVLAEDEDCPDFDCPVKDGSFAVSILDLATCQEKKDRLTNDFPGPVHMPSVLLLHRLPPSQATLSFWSLLGRYQVSIKGFQILRPMCSYFLLT